MRRFRMWLYLKLDDLAAWVCPYPEPGLNVGVSPDGLELYMTDSQLELFEANVPNHGYIFTKVI